MYRLALPKDLKQAASLEKRHGKKERSSISFQKRPISNYKQKAPDGSEKSILSNSKAFSADFSGCDTSVDICLDGVLSDSCFRDDTSTILSQENEEQFDSLCHWSEREQKRWQYREAPGRAWETALIDRLTEFPQPPNQDLLLSKLSSAEDVHSKSSDAKGITHLRGLLRKEDGQKRRSTCDIVIKKYTSRKSQLVTAKEKIEHSAHRVRSPDFVSPQNESLLYTAKKSAIPVANAISHGTPSQQKDNSVEAASTELKRYITLNLLDNPKSTTTLQKTSELPPGAPQLYSAQTYGYSENRKGSNASRREMRRVQSDPSILQHLELRKPHRSTSEGVVDLAAIQRVEAFIRKESGNQNLGDSTLLRKIPMRLNRKSSILDSPSPHFTQKINNDSYEARQSVQGITACEVQPNAVDVLELNSLPEEQLARKRTSTVESLSGYLLHEVERIDSALYLNEAALDATDSVDNLAGRFGTGRLSTAYRLYRGDTSAGMEYLESACDGISSADFRQELRLNVSGEERNTPKRETELTVDTKTDTLKEHNPTLFGGLQTNSMVTQAVQMHPVRIDANEQHYKPGGRKRTQSTLDKDTFTLTSLTVSSDSNSSLHSATNSQVFPIQETVEPENRFATPTNGPLEMSKNIQLGGHVQDIETLQCSSDLQTRWNEASCDISDEPLHGPMAGTGLEDLVQPPVIDLRLTLTKKLKNLPEGIVLVHTQNDLDESSLLKLISENSDEKCQPYIVKVLRSCPKGKHVIQVSYIKDSSVQENLADTAYVIGRISPAHGVFHAHRPEIQVNNQTP